MATIKLYPTYCRSGYSTYSGTGTSTYLLVGNFVASSYPSYYAYQNGKNYRAVLGYDFSGLYGKTVTAVKLYCTANDNVIVGNAATVAFTATLANDKTWGTSGIASAATSSGSKVGTSNRYLRNITDGSFRTAIATINGVGYLHLRSSGYFKIWNGNTSDSQSSWAYLEVDYEDAPAPAPDDSITISGFKAERWEYDPDAGMYVKSSVGEKCGLSFTVSVDTAQEGHAENHITSAKLTYSINGGATHEVDITPSGSSSTMNVEDDLLILDDVEFFNNESYDLSLTVTDVYSTKTVSTMLSSASPIMHFAASRKGVAVGMFSSSQSGDADGKFECNYPAHFYKGVIVDGGLFTSGSVGNTNVSANSYADVNVSFGKTFDHVPMVIVTPRSSSTGVNMGSVSFAVLTGSTTTTGFKIRIFNNTSNTRGYAFDWIAF